MSKKIGILIESDFYEKEIFYYEHRFMEEDYEVHWLTRLWGQPSLTFYGHEYKVPLECHESFEGMSDEELRSYDAIIVPSAFVSDRLRYSEDLGQLAPATEFVKRAFAEPDILKGSAASWRLSTNRCMQRPWVSCSMAPKEQRRAKNSGYGIRTFSVV